MQNGDYAQSVARFIRRARGALFWRYAVRLAAGWCLAWGLVVLLARSLAGVPATRLLWGLAGLLPCAAAAVVLAIRRCPSRASVKALLDRGSRCGGLLMAQGEVPLGRWADRVPPVRVPAVRWRGRRSLALAAAAGAFLTAGFVVPQRYVSPPTARGLNVEGEVEDLRHRIEALEEEEVIDREAAADLVRKLDQTTAEASGERPAKTWEALDHLQDTLAGAAQAAARETQAQGERLAKAESLADALENEAADLDPAILTVAMKHLREMVEESAREDGLLSEDQAEALQEACQGTCLSAEDLRRLSECLGGCRGDLAARLGRLAEAGLLDLEGIDIEALLRACKGEGLAAFLEEADDQGLPVGEALMVWLEGLPGRGGINRGRGDAPMVWSDPDTREGVDFTEEVLPPATAADLKESRRVGVSVAAPTVGEGGEAASGALKGAAGGGGSAHTRPVLPRHRRAANRYFEREGTDAPGKPGGY